MLAGGATQRSPVRCKADRGISEVPVLQWGSFLRWSAAATAETTPEQGAENPEEQEALEKCRCFEFFFCFLSLSGISL